MLLHAFPVLAGSADVIRIEVEYDEEDVLHLDDEEVHAEEHGQHKDDEEADLDED